MTNEETDMTSSDDIALSVKHVSKNFQLPTEPVNTLKGNLFNLIHGTTGYKTQHVLKDISFDVKKGDFYGIVGKNGSGKSTLLKIISEIYSTDGGSVEVHGKLVPFIELGVGFNPELTGRENVYMNGAMLGFTRSQVDDMYDDIVAFAELEDFMEQKLKNYSSGMQVRLAFSVAIKSQGDILVLDEVLAVGDEAFQKKCQDYFFEAKRQKKTVILVTHSMPDVRRYCTKALFIQDGRISKMGVPDEIADAYSDSFLPSKNEPAQNAANTATETETPVEPVDFISMTTLVDGEEQKMMAVGEDFTFQTKVKVNKPTSAHNLSIDVFDGRGILVQTLVLGEEGDEPLSVGEHTLTTTFKNVMAFGDFHTNLNRQDGEEGFSVRDIACRFHLKGMAGRSMPVIDVPTQTVITND